MPSAYNNREVKVWLPGSTIRLEWNAGKLITRGNVMLIEGNIDPGSALEQDQ